MEAIVLAGGFGTRLRQLVPGMPKPMAPVAGRPFLEILLASLASKGVRRVVLSLGYMAEKVMDHFGDHYEGLELIYEVEVVPLGTGGALRQALPRCHADHVFVFNGDTFLDLEMSMLEMDWQKNHEPIIVAREVQDTSRYGRLETVNGYATGIEKGVPGLGLINAGCYVLPVVILNDFPLGEFFSFEDDFLAKAMSKQRFDLVVTNGRFIDIGVPEDYARAQIELSGELF